MFYDIPDAAITGQLRLVKMLIERGADPLAKNRKGKTPCDVAAAAVHNFIMSAKGELFYFFSFFKPKLSYRVEERLENNKKKKSDIIIVI